jgi:hypothetical protein
MCQIILPTSKISKSIMLRGTSCIYLYRFSKHGVQYFSIIVLISDESHDHRVRLGLLVFKTRHAKLFHAVLAVYFSKFITHSLTYGAEPFLKSCQMCSYSRTSQHFIEPEGSLPCSQEPSTGVGP